MSQNPCRSVHVVIFSPRPRSQSSTRPVNCLKRSFISSLAWPMAVRMPSLTEHTKKNSVILYMSSTVLLSLVHWSHFCVRLWIVVWNRGWSHVTQPTSNRHIWTQNSLSSGMDSSSTLHSQWTHRAVSRSVSLEISDLIKKERKHQRLKVRFSKNSAEDYNYYSFKKSHLK